MSDARTHVGGPLLAALALAGCASAPPPRATPEVVEAPAVQDSPPAVATGLTVLDHGAEPWDGDAWQLLRYRTVAFDHDVRFTWAKFTTSGGGCYGRSWATRYLPRTLEGALVHEAPGRARLDRILGRAPVHEGPDIFHVVQPDFAAELPASFTFSIDERSFDIDAVDWRARSQDGEYRQDLLAALPSAVPDALVGIGARWQIVTTDESSTTSTTTWELAEIDSQRAVLIQRAPWVRTTIDLATFAIESEVRLHEWSSSATSRPTWGDRRVSATLSITPRAAPPP